MNTIISSGRVVGINKVLPMFFLSLLIACIGTAIGSFVPPALMLPLAVAELVMLLIASFVRKRRVGYTFVFLFTLISGITFYPILSHFLGRIGGDMVMAAFAVTTFAYGACTIYAIRSKANFSYLGGFLFVGLMALIGMSLWNVFFPLGSVAHLAFTLLGVFIFIGYTLYDVNNIARHGVPEELVPVVVLNLYLNFINLLQFILQLFGINLNFSNDD